MWRLLVQGCLDFLWPPRTQCLLCPNPLTETSVAELLCQDCWERMGFQESITVCRHCSRPVADGSDLCRECAEGSPFGRVFALGLHEGPLREAIHHLKFAGRYELGPLLGKRLASQLPSAWECILPVPLHRSRLLDRGYNQAAAIAKGIAELHPWPVPDKHLLRLRRTAHQAKLHRGERMKNLVGAFGVKRGTPPWQDKAVLLVDDVLTTGSTVAAVAQVLYDSGARSVDVAVLAVSTKPVKGTSKIPVNDLRLIIDT